jgi:hypothetical protein
MADALFAAMERTRPAIDVLQPTASTPDDIIFLERIRDAVNTMARLRTHDERLLPSAQVALALVDAEELARLVQGIRKDRFQRGDLEVAAAHSDRIMRAIGYLALAPSDQPRISHTQPSATATSLTTGDDVNHGLGTLAVDYGADARREQLVVQVIYFTTLMVVVGATAVSIAGIRDGRQGAAFDFHRYVPFGLTSVMLLLLAAVAVRQAGKHRQAEQEARRLQRQLQGLHPYLSLMPEALRSLFLATLVPSLFSRLPDEEPWREPRWPEPEALLAALQPSVPPGTAGSTQVTDLQSRLGWLRRLRFRPVSRHGSD